MLQAADLFLTVFHLVNILFNLFGWVPKPTRRTNLIVLMLTAASWLLPGIWYGMGYCPVTHWQWKVKERLGETNLPPNFVEYFAERATGKTSAQNW